MKLRSNTPSLPRSLSGFTMVEIALAIGVIGFALIAIVGILPLGLTVEKDNREDTIINQDGPYFLEAIRGGAKAFDNLTNFVESISITKYFPGGTNLVIYTNLSGQSAAPFDGRMTNGAWIIGLLGTPKYKDGITNEVIARVQALSGSALEQGANKMVSFAYLLRSEIVPFTCVNPDSTNFSAYLSTNADYIIRSNRWTQVRSLTNNLCEVRLTFSWPLLPNGLAGPYRKTFRTLAGGTLTPLPMGNGATNFFFANLFQQNAQTP
jgi:hypothetical protein